MGKNKGEGREHNCPVCDRPAPVGSYCPHCRTRVGGHKLRARSAWMMVGGAAFVLVALALWTHRLRSSIPEERSDLEITASLKPDGTKQPGQPVPVPFGEERCVPWHVSAVHAPPKKADILVLTSQIVDPYGLTLSGFGEECKDLPASIIVEHAGLDDVRRALEKKTPQAILAVGKRAFDLAREAAPSVPVLFAMVVNPLASGLDAADTAGVTPWVPAEPLIRHLLTVLPRKAKLAVFAPEEALAPVTRDMVGEIRKLGREVRLFEIGDDTDLDALLKEAAKEFRAWIVVVDRTVVDDEVFNRIQIAAENERIPLGVSDEEHVRRGALVGAGPDSHRVGRQLCRLAGALIRKELPAGSHIFCPEYTFGAIHQATAEKLGYMLGLKEIVQAKLYKWH
jgi:ABC-type uncharacterized transport system substrate-binding protein